MAQRRETTAVIVEKTMSEINTLIHTVGTVCVQWKKG